ncbi:MAG: hypothetical protein ABH886_08235 [Candidatus Desantisbacteria bacterium]
MVTNTTDNQQTDTHKEVAPLAGMSLRNTDNILYASHAKCLFRNSLSSPYVIKGVICEFDTYLS